SRGRVLFGLDINDKAAKFAKKFSAHKGEIVVLPLKVGVEDDHLSETSWQEVHGVDAGQMVHHAVSKTRLADEGSVLRPVAHVQASQKVLVLGGLSDALLVVFQVLEIGLDHGAH